MPCLELVFNAPMQSWGAESRFNERGTEKFPTKSGVIGLIAAAQGRERDADISDLRSLKVACRVEKAGEMERDYQTARPPGSSNSKLSNRYYLTGAVFLVLVEGSEEQLTEVRDALLAPKFALYLGRRAFPVNPDAVRSIHEGSAMELLESLDWRGADRLFKAKGDSSVVNEPAELRVIREIEPGERPSFTLRDDPISFDPQRKLWAARPLISYRVANPSAPSSTPASDPDDPSNQGALGDGEFFEGVGPRFDAEHDPMAEVLNVSDEV